MGSTGDEEEKWFPPHMHSEFSMLKNSWDRFKRGSDHCTLKYSEKVML